MNVAEQELERKPVELLEQEPAEKPEWVPAEILERALALQEIAPEQTRLVYQGNLFYTHLLVLASHYYFPLLHRSMQRMLKQQLASR